MIHADEDPLQKQFNTLEMEWDSIKQSFSRSAGRRSFSTDSPPTAAVHNPLFQMLDHSPKLLMSVLQHENQDSVPQDRSTIEVLEEGEADFDNGRLKGRRLFEESDMDSDDIGGTGKSEVSTQFSYKCSEKDNENQNRFTGQRDSYLQPPAVVVNRDGRRSSIGRRMVRMTWISVVVMVFALAIVAFKGRGEDEQILVPT